MQNHSLYNNILESLYKKFPEFILRFQPHDFTIKEPYEAARPGVFHGALYEKARAGRNGRPFLLAPATRVAP
jgi:hypothetical protein